MNEHRCVAIPWDTDFYSFWYIHKFRIADHMCRSIFNFQNKLHSFFHSCWNILHHSNLSVLIIIPILINPYYCNICHLTAVERFIAIILTWFSLGTCDHWASCMLGLLASEYWSNLHYTDSFLLVELHVSVPLALDTELQEKLSVCVLYPSFLLGKWFENILN